jgi:hypothetical protein
VARAARFLSTNSSKYLSYPLLVVLPNLTDPRCFYATDEIEILNRYYIKESNKVSDAVESTAYALATRINAL